MENHNSVDIHDIDSSNSDEVCYFSHIPKTGGTSFTTILDRFFHVRDIFEPQLWWEVGNIQEVRKQNFKCIRGHFGMGAKSLSNCKLRTLTIVRDPLKLAYSTFQYIKREVNTNVHDYVVTNNLTFEEFLLDPLTRNLAKNRMLKSLSFGMGLDNSEADLSVTPENYKQCRKKWNIERKKMPSHQLLEIVKVYLDQCFWVGVLENFELSLKLLSLQMSWPLIGPTEKLNKHSKIPKISQRAENIVREMNQLDYELYDYAKNIFEKKISKIFDNSNNKSINQLIDSRYQESKSMGRLRSFQSINYDFSMPLFGQNWHRREWDEASQKYFRWTGPEPEFSVDFWLNSHNYQVCFKFINVGTLHLIENLIVTVNNHKVDYSYELNGRAGWIKFICEKYMVQSNGLMRIKMDMNSIGTHHDEFNSNDSRKVGLAMQFIKITKSEQPKK